MGRFTFTFTACILQGLERARFECVWSPPPRFLPPPPILLPFFSASASRLGLSFNPTGALNQSSMSAGVPNLVLPDGALLDLHTYNSQPCLHLPRSNVG